MLSPELFTASYIQKIQKETHCDPALIERVVYSFGLLEALARVGLPFIFKGGTAILLLLPSPQRFSTDIDILVEPGNEIEMLSLCNGEQLRKAISLDNIQNIDYTNTGVKK